MTEPVISLDDIIKTLGVWLLQHKFRWGSRPAEVFVRGGDPGEVVVDVGTVDHSEPYSLAEALEACEAKVLPSSNLTVGGMPAGRLERDVLDAILSTIMRELLPFLTVLVARHLAGEKGYSVTLEADDGVKVVPDAADSVCIGQAILGDPVGISVWTGETNMGQLSQFIRQPPDVVTGIMILDGQSGLRGIAMGCSPRGKWCPDGEQRLDVVPWPDDASLTIVASQDIIFRKTVELVRGLCENTTECMVTIGEAIDVVIAKTAR